MKEILLFSLCLLALWGCGDNDDDQGSVSLRLDHEVGGADLVFDEIRYTNAAGNEYGITLLEYILTEVALERGDGRRAMLSTLHYGNAQEPSTHSLTAKVPGGQYAALVFTFGIDGARNTSGNLPNRDVYNNMAWPAPMGGGYHYMRFEGLFRSSAGESAFLTHTGPSGGKDYSLDIALPLSLEVNGDDWEIQVLMDVDKWYAAPHVYNFEGKGMIMGNQELQSLLQTNGAGVFSLGSLHHIGHDHEHEPHE